MLDFLTRLFDSSGFPRRWSCGQWSDTLGWTHVLADLATWGAYTAIPLVLAYFVLRRKDTPFPKIFILFACFIFACGTVHLIEATIFWWPIYRFSGVVKVGTAVVSWATVLALIPATPKALALPGLAKVNALLEAEIRDRRAAEDALRDNERRFRAVVESAGEGIITVGQAGEVVTLNPAAERIFGSSAGALLGRNVTELIPRFQALSDGHTVDVATQSPSGKPQRAEGRKGNQSFPLELTLAKSQVADQPGYICVVRDITDRTRMEEQQSLLMAELSHRVKNTLATVQAISMHTMQFSEGLPAFQSALEGRLRALSAAHNLLTAGKWEGISLREIVERELAPHGRPGSVSVDGPNVSLRPKAALAVHMALHELATNAAKYGAMSCETGQVEVRWTVRECDGPRPDTGRRPADGVADAGGTDSPTGGRADIPCEGGWELSFRWRESGGPAVAPPHRTGFGTQLIRTAIEYELEGEVRLDYGTEGLVGEIRLPWHDGLGYLMSPA